MPYLSAKDVRSIEYRFYELLYDAPGTKEDKQDFFQRRMKVLVPKTNYEVMWERLVDYLRRGGAGEAVFDYALDTADERMERLLEKASKGERVRLYENDRAAVRDIFWENGKLHRIGQHLVGYMAQRKPVVDYGLEGFQPPPKKFPYDVALSYASEQRKYVRQVYERLVELRITTFYDEGEVVSLWGKDLEAQFEAVFRKMARACVVFVSKDYVSKLWPRFEAQSALARAVQEKGEYVLPVRFDGSELPGLLPTIKYLWAKDYTPYQLAQIIKNKLEELK